MSETESYQEHKRNKYFTRILEEKLALIILAPIVAVIITTFIFHFYRVDGHSMEKTFQDNDLLLVEKVGKTTSTILRKNYLPQRYDIIVFTQPNYDPNIELVKRVIGLPGDRVVVKNKEIKVYNRENPEGINIDENLPGEASEIEFVSRFEKSDVNIKDGEVFVLGDNRPGSDDSRFFGPVETNNIVGKVIVRIMPFDNFLIL